MQQADQNQANYGTLSWPKNSPESENEFTNSYVNLSPYCRPPFIRSSSGGRTSHSTTSEPHSVYNLDSFPTPEASTTSSPSLPLIPASKSSSACICLEKHSELHCYLRTLEKSQNTQFVDSILTNVQQALTPWQNLIDCPTCPHDDDQTVLLLSFMSMRSILRRYDCLCFGSDEKSTSAPATGYSTPVQQTSDRGGLTYGSYKATKTEHGLVTDLLITEALGKLRFAFFSMKQKLEQSRRHQKNLPSNQVSLGGRSNLSFKDLEVNVVYLYQTLRSLEETLQTLVAAAANRNPGVFNRFGNGGSSI